MVPGEIKTAADLKGKRLSATGGGVGGFNWRMGREVLKSAKLDVGDAQFIPSPTAGRLPGLIAGQIDGVALHPEDVFLAQQAEAHAAPAGAARRSDAALHVQRLRRLDRMDRQGPRAAARHRRRHDRGQPHDLPRQGQGGADHGRRRPQKPKDAVEYAWEIETKNCVWSVNTGFTEKRTQWSIDNSVENGDIEADKKPTVEQVANIKLAEEAVELAGGRVTIGKCTE